MVVLTSKPLETGKWSAPDFNLKGTDEHMHSLSDFKKGKGIVVYFTCNHCPYAKVSWPLMIDLAKEYKDRRIKFVAINPNEPMHPDDSFERMKEEVIERTIPFPYLVDSTQEVAQAYQAQCTPDIYLFDENMNLYYHGRINDSWQDARQVKEENLKDAIESLLHGDSPPKLQPPSMGCSIKWK
ncbi:thioredoxin family protein [Candidatus Roizmanbacteria bacterium]|nr:thioredoxin family protein [Candidatus Roizmanbacteria bacterium]